MKTRKPIPFWLSILLLVTGGAAAADDIALLCTPKSDIVWELSATVEADVRDIDQKLVGATLRSSGREFDLNWLYLVNSAERNELMTNPAVTSIKRTIRWRVYFNRTESPQAPASQAKTSDLNYPMPVKQLEGLRNRVVLPTITLKQYLNRPIPAAAGYDFIAALWREDMANNRRWVNLSRTRWGSTCGGPAVTP